ncbi:MAG TPA: NADH-quinone oxidoreductase subunit H [Clostridia bacterium]|nr:NADH-quinone oxidoreductase subunit H [Clostridia bacterium]
MVKLFAILMQLLLVIILAPLVNGVIKKVKAFSEKRWGAPVLQMYYDLYKLFRKGTVVSDVSSWIFRATPWIFFGTTLTATLFVPISGNFLLLNFQGDLILLIYLLALGNFFMCLAALDTGGTFGGMGSSREVMIAAIMEPALLVSLFTVGLFANSTSIPRIMQVMQESGGIVAHPGLVLLAIAIMIVILAVNSRLPFDDPGTHLELTMVHEAMILEYSGKHLALMEWGAAIKQLLLILLVLNVFFPHEQFLGAAGIGVLLPVSLLLTFLKIILVSVIIGIAEFSTIKFRLFSVPNLAAISFTLSFIGFLQLFVLGR